MSTSASEADGANQDEPEGRGAFGQLLHSLIGMAGTLLAILHTRLELLGADIQSSARNTIALLLWSLAALLSAGIGLIFAALTIVIVYWDTHRVLAAIAVTACFLGFAILAVLIVISRLRQLPRLFEATLTELAQDQEQLRNLK